jgi:metallo-beta-lactamase family protein
LRISFHGADRDVTGSCHLVECAGHRVLVDCGLYQGSHELESRNAAPFGFEPTDIDYLLLTHAHLDHCGRLPLLAKDGFHGEVITTAATRELSRLVMMDSAHLMEEDARHAARRAARHGKPPAEPTTPLYSVPDVLNCTERFGRTASYNQPIKLADGLQATFIDAGHILGSACILLEMQEQPRTCKALFSGDLGSPGHPLLRGPATPPQADVVVMESTYGDRLHRKLDASVDELLDAIHDAFKRGGNVIIPTFALERAQELLFYLNRGVAEGRLAASTQVFLDSPMAISATEIFRRHPECYEPATAQLFAEGRDPFQLPGLHFTRETAESVTINRIHGGAIIMAGSGMCTGGRVRHHLKHNLWRKDSSVVFVGYAAAGTLARDIIDGAKKVHLFGEEIPVRARIYTINGFSAHADQTELLAWREQTHSARTFLVHGEADAMTKFTARLTDTKVEMPTLGQVFDL